MKTIQAAELVGDPRRSDETTLFGSFLSRERIPRPHHEEVLSRIWRPILEIVEPEISK